MYQVDVLRQQCDEAPKEWVLTYAANSNTIPMIT